MLKDGLLVKTVKFKNPKHISEPIYAIKIFNDYEVDELIIIDIMASRFNPIQSAPIKKQIPFELITKISDESCMPITYGGGVASLNDFRLLFKAGIEKVCINTNAICNPQLIIDAAKEFGRQSIVVSIDVKQQPDSSYNVVTHCGLQNQKLDPIACAAQMASLGAGEILVNSIDRDGTMRGYDIPLIMSFTSKLHVPVIALGGAGTIQDLSLALNDGGASAAAAGSMFVYFGRKKAVLINYPDRNEIADILKTP